MLPSPSVHTRYPYAVSHTRWDYFKRIFKLHQVDLEYTFAQMIYLCVAPTKVYHFVSYRKQTKDHWARDDPALAVCIIFFLSITGLCYGICFGIDDLSGLLYTCLIPPVCFLSTGILIATGAHSIANRYLRVYSFHSNEQTLEWAYCFDIHCNATFPYILLCFVLHYIILPAIYPSTLIPCIVSNILHTIGLCYYCYITSLGYSTLPFLDKTEVFLYPCVVGAFIAVIFSIFRVSFTRMWLPFLIGVD